PFSFASLCFLESFHHPFLASIIPLLPSFFHKKNKAHWFIVDFVSSLQVVSEKKRLSFFLLFSAGLKV
ncbi:MAG: hypothetical protein IKN72_09015, partial [Clostridia bacterium]|nr:hypothetical protein [Clostridia bacterium]